MNYYKIAVCEDDRKSIRRIEEIIRDTCSKEIRFFEYLSGEDLLKETEQNHQIIIMDVFLKTIDGFETARRVRKYNRDAILVFCSGETDPTPESIEVTPYRYLKKQYSDERMKAEFGAVFEKAAEIFDCNALEVKDKTDGQKHLVPVSQITYISKAKYGSYVHLANGSSADADILLEKRSVKMLYEELRTSGFEWAHNSYIINCRMIDSYDKKKVVLANQKELGISRSKYQTFTDALAEYWGRKYTIT